MISVLPLGVGRGADSVISGECSSAYVIMSGTEPILLFDVGFGVVRQYYKHFNTLDCPIYVSHNHSDHAAELPVIGALSRGQGRKQTVYADSKVMSVLKLHRLHELQSTGLSIAEFFDFREFPGVGEPLPLSALTIKTVQGQHSEQSFGLIFSYKQKPILGIGSDSGFDETVYERLAESPMIILDGRENGSKEHASFSEIENWTKGQTNVKVWVSGYGKTDYVPTGFTLVQPHHRIEVVT